MNTKLKIHKNYQESKDQLLQAISNFENTGYELGNQKRNTIKVIALDDIELNIKSFKKPGLINKFAYTYLRKSKAQRSYEFGSIMLSKGILTPQPIACLLYTSDAADDMQCVDLGGRRII